MNYTKYWLSVVILSLLSAATWGFEMHFGPSLFVDFDLLPGKPIVFANKESKVFNGYCVMHTTGSSNNYVLIKNLLGYGEFNGTTLKSGESLVISIYNMQFIHIILTPGTQAQFTNLGDQLIQASCVKSSQ